MKNELFRYLEEQAEKMEIYRMDDIHDTGTLLDDFAKHSTLLQRGQNIDSHRWFILQTDVYKYRGYFVGVTYIREHKSEMQSDSDVGITLTFSLMNRIPSYKYVLKKPKEESEIEE